MSSCKDINKAVFYLQKTVENGWSRAVLLNFLDTDLYERQGKAVNNFSRFLPDTQSELAQQTLKDSYTFDFITLTENYKERELEDALTGNITRFLIELGCRRLLYRSIPFMQKGAIENANGLIRQYIPKKSSFAHYDDNDIQRILAKINKRWRNKPAFATPKIAF